MHITLHDKYNHAYLSEIYFLLLKFDRYYNTKIDSQLLNMLQMTLDLVPLFGILSATPSLTTVLNYVCRLYGFMGFSSCRKSKCQ